MSIIQQTVKSLPTTRVLYWRYTEDALDERSSEANRSRKDMDRVSLVIKKRCTNYC